VQPLLEKLNGLHLFEQSTGASSRMRIKPRLLPQNETTGLNSKYRGFKNSLKTSLTAFILTESRV